jgi:hypothetical protein
MENEEQTNLVQEEAPKDLPKRRPKRSLRVNLSSTKGSIDLAMWEGFTSKEGKPLQTSISLKLQDANPEVTRNAIYFKASDALKIANVLQNFAFNAMEEDSSRRIGFARENKQVSIPA